MHVAQFRAKTRAAELDCIQRPVIALSDEYPAGFFDPRHTHRRAQLLYAISGVMSVATDTGSYVIPPLRAIWIPAQTPHEMSCRGSVSLRTLYLDLSCCARLPQRCCVIEISALLKALIVEIMGFCTEYDMGGREGKIVQLFLEELELMPMHPLHAPMPTDVRLAKVCRSILADPAREGDLDNWARAAGMGRRTLTRLFRQDTGMSLAAWRQQVRLLEALSLLTIGRPVTNVAYDVGYASPSAFSAAFHRTFGASPSQFVPKAIVGPTI